jgi:hypothetical protein
MDRHALLIHTVIRHPQVDSPEIARRREQLLRLEQEAREARRHRRRERVRRARSALFTLHRTGSDDRVRRVEASDLEALR